MVIQHDFGVLVRGGLNPSSAILSSQISSVVGFNMWSLVTSIFIYDGHLFGQAAFSLN